ncbi:MAG: hypothetical protein IRY85_07685 [Micromonosporaceae bacterium]|nr:hypothetical protein [Micromonosporaceae bacterium]
MERQREAGRDSRPRWLAWVATVLVVTAGSVVAVAAPAQAAISNVRIVETIFFAPKMSTTLGAVDCNTNEKVLGGGLLVMGLDPNIRVIESLAKTDTKWGWAVYNPTQNIPEIHARAICAQGVTGYKRVDGKADTVPPGGAVKDITATCPSGMTSISGGFGIQANPFERDKLKVAASQVFGNGWKIQIRNDSVSPWAGFAQVICTTLPGRLTPDPVTVTVAAGSTTAASRDCGSNHQLVGGGWVTNQNIPHNIVTAAIPTDATNDNWKINLANRDSVSHTVKLIIVCLPK